MNRLIRFLSVCLLLSFVFPVQAKVEGVTVLAQDGDSPVLKKNITEVIEALFDIEPHKIKVAKKGEQETEEQRELRFGIALSEFKTSYIWKKYQEGKEQGLNIEEIKQKYGMREGEIALVERYERVIEEYDVKKKITGQSIGQVSYTATVQECDEAQTDLNKLIHEQQEITQKD